MANNVFLELVLSRNFDENSVKEIAEKIKLDDELLGIVEFTDGKKNMGFNELGILRKVNFKSWRNYKIKPSRTYTSTRSRPKNFTESTFPGRALR